MEKSNINIGFDKKPEFRKKTETPAPETNYGWRGVNNGFQKKMESQDTPLDVAHNAENISIPSEGKKLGGININNINMDKISINESYERKAVVSANVLSDSEFVRQKTNLTFDSDKQYTAQIKINRPNDTKIRFDDINGFSQTPVSQQNLNSVSSKLGEQNIKIENLTPNELQNFAKTGTINGKRITLSEAERQTITSYANTKGNSKSLSNLRSSTETGFRKKATPENVKKATDNIKFQDNGSVISDTGRIRFTNGDLSTTTLSRSSRIKVSTKGAENSSGALSSGLSNVKLSDNTLAKNFATGNISVAVKDSKLNITGGNIKTGTNSIKQPVKKIPAILDKTTSVFSKFAGSLTNKATGMTSALSKGTSGGLMGMFSGKSGSTITGMVAILAAVVMLFGTLFNSVFGVLMPTNNVEYTEDDRLLAGSDANSTLQRVINELAYKQRAYEFNLVYADTSTKDAETGNLYIETGIPESWHDKIKELETVRSEKIPGTYETGYEDGKAAVVNINEEHDQHLAKGAEVANVYYGGKLMGHRLKHFWGPVTALYPATEYIYSETDKANGLDNRIVVWEEKKNYYDENGVWHDIGLVSHSEYMQLYCVGGLHGYAGMYYKNTNGEAVHVNHKSSAYKNLGHKIEETNYEEGQKNGEVNKNITVEYQYEGSKYSYLFTDKKSTFYETSDSTPEKRIKVTYDTYEFYRALISATTAYVGNGQENFKFFEEYMTRLFDAAMDNAKIEIKGGYGGNFFQVNSEKELHWTYQDPVGYNNRLPGKDGTPDGKSTCYSPSVNCKAKIVITITDAGLQDLMKLDINTDDTKSHEKVGFASALITKIKNFLNQFFGGDQKGSIDKFIIDEKNDTHYNEWIDWTHEGNGDEGGTYNSYDIGGVPYYGTDEVQRNSPQMSYAVMLTDFDKETFNDFYEGLKLPTSSILQDYVEDDSDIEYVPDGTIAGDIQRPDLTEGVYLNNLCYINQGQGQLAQRTRYIDDNGDIHTFQRSGCLDSSIMMIYLHYYHENAESTTAGEILQLWDDFFAPYIYDGSGLLDTSTVIASLGLTASGKNVVSECGWEKLIDSLHLGNPVLLHISGHWEYGGEVLHQSPGGHFLIAVGVDSTGIYVYDPGRRANTGKCIPWDAWCSGGVYDVYYKIYNATGATISDLANISIVTDYSNMPEGVLTKKGGVNYYGGRKETYYNMPIAPEGILVKRAWEHGIEGQYHESPEGYKMVGDYIIVAANFKTYPIGTIIETSLGKAVVLDTGDFAAGNPNQIDIAVNW